MRIRVGLDDDRQLPILYMYVQCLMQIGADRGASYRSDTPSRIRIQPCFGVLSNMEIE